MNARRAIKNNSGVSKCVSKKDWDLARNTRHLEVTAEESAGGLPPLNSQNRIHTSDRIAQSPCQTSAKRGSEVVSDNRSNLFTGKELMRGWALRLMRKAELNDWRFDRGRSHGRLLPLFAQDRVPGHRCGVGGLEPRGATAQLLKVGFLVSEMFFGWRWRTSARDPAGIEGYDPATGGAVRGPAPVRPWARHSS